MIWGYHYFWKHPYRDILDTYHLNSLKQKQQKDFRGRQLLSPPAESKAVEGSPEALKQHRRLRENIRFFLSLNADSCCWFGWFRTLNQYNADISNYVYINVYTYPYMLLQMPVEM